MGAAAGATDGAPGRGPGRRWPGGTRRAVAGEAMRSHGIAVLIGVALGAAAVELWHARAGEPRGRVADVGSRAADPAAPTPSAPPAPAGLASVPRGDRALEERLAAVEALLARVAQRLEAPAASDRASSDVRPAVVHGVTRRDDVETVRRAWGAVLDRNEENLRVDAPRDGRTDPVYEAYLGDIRTARAALDAARTPADLERLAREHPRIFGFD